MGALSIGAAGAYNEDIARGWESKSVEAQIDVAEDPSDAPTLKTHAPETLELIRKKETILLSRIRVIRELSPRRIHATRPS